MGVTGSDWTVGGDLVVTGGGMRDVLVFSQPNCTAGQTDVPLAFLDAADSAITGIPMTRAGSICALWVRSENLQTAGSATVTVTIDGATTSAIRAINSGNRQNSASTYAMNVIPFTAGQLLGCQVTSTGDWAAGTTPSLIVLVEFET